MLEDGQGHARPRRDLGDDPGGVLQPPERLGPHHDGIRRPDVAGEIDVGTDGRGQRRPPGDPERARPVDRRAEAQEGRFVVEHDEPGPIRAGDEQVDGRRPEIDGGGRPAGHRPGPRQARGGAGSRARLRTRRSIRRSRGGGRGRGPVPSPSGGLVRRRLRRGRLRRGRLGVAGRLGRGRLHRCRPGGRVRGHRPGGGRLRRARRRRDLAWSSPPTLRCRGRPGLELADRDEQRVELPDLVADLVQARRAAVAVALVGLLEARDAPRLLGTGSGQGELQPLDVAAEGRLGGHLAGRRLRRLDGRRIARLLGHRASWFRPTFWSPLAPGCSAGVVNRRLTGGGARRTASERERDPDPDQPDRRATSGEQDDGTGDAKRASRCSPRANIAETAPGNAWAGPRFPTRRRARSVRRSLLLAGVLLGHTGQFRPRRDRIHRALTIHKEPVDPRSARLRRHHVPRDGVMEHPSFPRRRRGGLLDRAFASVRRRPDGRQLVRPCGLQLGCDPEPVERSGRLGRSRRLPVRRRWRSPRLRDRQRHRRRLDRPPAARRRGRQGLRRGLPGGPRSRSRAAAPAPA